PTEQSPSPPRRHRKTTNLASSPTRRSSDLHTEVYEPQAATSKPSVTKSSSRRADKAASRSSRSTRPRCHGRPSDMPEYSGMSDRSEEHTSELQSLAYLVCRLLLEKKKH